MTKVAMTRAEAIEKVASKLSEHPVYGPTPVATACAIAEGGIIILEALGLITFEDAKDAR